jgi:acetyl-CoA carboxylase carboxyltransferase component
VKAAIGQDVDSEELGGAKMHAEISGTIDYREPDDKSCLKRLRDLMLADMRTPPMQDAPIESAAPANDPSNVYDVFSGDAREQYDVVELLSSIVDDHSWNEYRAEFGSSVVCGYARIDGWPCGIVANQRKMTERVMPGGKDGPSKAMNMPAVIYVESADKAARFIMDCNQKRIPIVFMHDTSGFMVGRDSEQAGIIRSGAKMVNAMSNCIVPKISLITGGSYGAGNYAMCGRAFDPFLTLAWPGSRCAVMGAQAAAGTLLQIDLAARKRRGEEIDEEERQQLLEAITASYSEQQDIRYGAARGWVDRIIEPHHTRAELGAALQIASTFPATGEYLTGVLQT